MSGAPSVTNCRTARCDVAHSPLMCHDDVPLCAHIAPSCVLAMVIGLLWIVCPIASAHGRESGASGSTFERFRRLGVGPRSAARLRIVDLVTEMLTGFSLRRTTVAWYSTRSKHVHNLSCLRGGP